MFSFLKAALIGAAGFIFGSTLGGFDYLITEAAAWIPYQLEDTASSFTDFAIPMFAITNHYLPVSHMLAAVAAYVAIWVVLTSYRWFIYHFPTVG